MRIYIKKYKDCTSVESYFNALKYGQDRLKIEEKTRQINLEKNSNDIFLIVAEYFFHNNEDFVA